MTQTEFQGRAVPGPVILMTGNWDSNERYRPGNLVKSGGTAYVALRTHSGITPGTDSTAWTGVSTGAIGAKGDTGDAGADGTTPGLLDIGALLTTAGITSASSLPDVLAAFGITP